METGGLARFFESAYVKKFSLETNFWKVLSNCSIQLHREISRELVCKLDNRLSHHANISILRLAPNGRKSLRNLRIFDLSKYSVERQINFSICHHSFLEPKAAFCNGRHLDCRLIQDSTRCSD